jgi:hypothetical protein
MDNTIEANHKQFLEVMRECESLRRKKVDDYGLTYRDFGYVGVLVKLGDKYGRVKNLYEKSLKGEKPNFETSRDSLIDLVNYTIMAIMELDSQNKFTKGG